MPVAVLIEYHIKAEDGVTRSRLMPSQDMSDPGHFYRRKGCQSDQETH